MGQKISITQEDIKEAVIRVINILKESNLSYDINSDEYGEMFDGPDKREREAYDVNQGYDKLDAVGDEWLEHDKEDEDEEFPRIKPYQSAEQERNGEWDDIAKPGSYPHIRGFMKKFGTSVDEVEDFIRSAEDKFGDPEWRNEAFRDGYPKMWKNSKFAKLYKKYVSKYHMDEFGGMEHFPYDTEFSEFDYFGKMRP